MDESILESVKKDLGAMVSPEDEIPFDDTLIRHINSVFMILYQLGLGPIHGYSISGKDNVWSEFVDPNDNLEAIKSYMSKKVRLLFDPPSSSFVLESERKLCDEMEWRLNVMVDPEME